MLKNSKISEQRRKRQRGNALLEGVLTMTTFCAMLMGVFDIGQLFLAQQTVTGRANDAVRWAAVTPWDATSTPASVQNRIRFGSDPPPDGASSLYGIAASAISVTRPTADYSCADRVVIVVSPIQITTYANAFISLLSGGSGNNSFPTLTVKVSLPYEVSNGSSH